MQQLKKSLFTFIPVLFLMLLLEAGLRLVKTPDVSKGSTSTQQYLQHAHVPNSSFQYTKKSFSSLVEQNNIGAHDIEHNYHKAKNVKRILIIGDSFVEAHQVHRNETFFRKLEEHLNQSSNTVAFEVIALGMSGYGPEKEYHLLRNVGMKYHPDLVLLCFLEGNDIRDVSQILTQKVRAWTVFSNELAANTKESRHFLPLSRYLRISEWTGRKIGLIMKRYIYLFNDEIKGEETIPPDYFIYQKDLSTEFKEAWEKAFFYFNGMKELCQSNSTEFRIISLGSRMNIHHKKKRNMFQNYPYMKKMAWDFQQPERLLKEFCRKNAIPFYSLGQSLASCNTTIKKDLFFPNDGHWTETGHTYAALYLSEWLKKQPLSVPPVKTQVPKPFPVPVNPLDQPVTFNDPVDFFEETKAYITLPALEKERGIEILWKSFLTTSPIRMNKGFYSFHLQAKGISANNIFPHIGAFLVTYPPRFPVRQPHKPPRTDPLVFHYNFLKHHDFYLKNHSFFSSLDKKNIFSDKINGLKLLTLRTENTWKDYRSHIFEIPETGDFFLTLSFPDDGRIFYTNGKVEDQRIFIKNLSFQTEKQTEF